MRIYKAITIAGSDCSGGAGIQADLKTFQSLGIHGMSVITAVTAQNSFGVSEIFPMNLHCIESQLAALLTDIGADAVKTGMLPTPESIYMIVDLLKRYGVPPLVVDPVMRPKGGKDLMDKRAVDAMVEALFPISDLITPNVPEASRLLGRDIHSKDAMAAAAAALHKLGPRNVLLKGGHLHDHMAVDVLYDGTNAIFVEAERLDNRHTHGTGCTLASAIAGWLAKGETMPSAVRKAKALVTEAIRSGYVLGGGTGPVNLLAKTAQSTE